MAASEAELKRLMLAGLAGDGAAHARLLAGLAGPLRAYFRRRLAEREDAEDLVQETLIAVHAKRGLFDPTEPLTPWVYGVARGDVERLLRRLTPRDRALVREVKLGGWSMAEAGGRRGLSETATKVAVHRAVKRLEREVGDEDR